MARPRSRPRPALAAAALVLALAAPGRAALAAEQALTLVEQGYFARPGVNLLVFSNHYDGLFSDAKISGVELIHHGVRTATNGDVRLQATPEQWDPTPALIRREVRPEAGVIEAFQHYPDYGFAYAIRVQAAGEGVTLTVQLPEPLPQALAGRAGFNLEFLPSAYFESAYLMDGKVGTFPLHPSGPAESAAGVEAQPLAAGASLSLAPGNDLRRVAIRSHSGELRLYDGRARAQNGWFVVREMLPVGRRGEVLRWTLSPAAQAGWLRTPVIGHSQVGYHPAQRKVAVIELDAADHREPAATLERIAGDGSRETVLSQQPVPWGRYQRYQYRTLDFSQVQRPGLYQLTYGDQRSQVFPIDRDVYATAWYPTLGVYMPVQMDHVLVKEAYRVWHGASHLDDARQAPVDHEHFDLYAQGPTTDTRYQGGEHIPGLDIGGWYDAGDYDIRTQTQYHTVSSLVAVWEAFAPQRDTTRVDYPARRVDLHVPDGVPDLLQQIAHGSLGLLAQHRAFGRAISGIIVPELSQYTHLGDGLTMTDNRVYDPALGPQERSGARSGLADDRWAFTSRSSALNYGSIAALAAASRALAGYDDDLAREARQVAIAAWAEEQGQAPFRFSHGNTTGGPLALEQYRAAVELLLSTGEPAYRRALEGMDATLQQYFRELAPYAVRALPHMAPAFAGRLEGYARDHVAALAARAQDNPYGVEITGGGWAGNGTIMANAIASYYLHRAFPALVDREQVLQALNYLYGTHPDSSLSFVSGVGTRSKRVAYGMNRADFSFIAGGIVPGVLLLQPDFPENKEDWPFFWGENEYVISLAPGHIFLALAADALLNPAAGEGAQ